MNNESSKYIAVFSNGEKVLVTEEMMYSLNVVEREIGKYHILYNNRSVEIDVIRKNYEAKEFHFLLDGRDVKLNLNDRLDLLIDQMGYRDLEVAAFKEVIAPMPGLVLDILVGEGEKVHKGDNLLILEAMKMENIIKADGEAVIKKISVQAKDKVLKNQLLIELE